jgi:hypothetical protein
MRMKTAKWVLIGLLAPQWCGANQVVPGAATDQRLFEVPLPTILNALGFYVPNVENARPLFTAYDYAGTGMSLSEARRASIDDMYAEEGFGRGPMTQAALQESRARPDRALPALLASIRVARQLRRTEDIPLEHEMKFRSQAYKFGINGEFIRRFEVVSVFDGEYSYDVLRGFWQDLRTTQVFWGAGIRVKFRISGYSVFGNGHYRLSWLNPNNNEKEENPLVRVYGDPSTTSSTGEYISGGSVTTVLKRLKALVNDAFMRSFAGDVEFVEPVYIRVPDYVRTNITTTPQPVRKIQRNQPQTTGFLKGGKE